MGAARPQVDSAAGRAGAVPGARVGDVARRGPEPVGAVAQRLREPVLRGGGQVDELELARLSVRIPRPRRHHDRRQATAGAVGAGAFGARVRLRLAQHPRAAGADGGGQRGAGIRPRAPTLRARRRVRRGPVAGVDADRGGDLAPQQPRQPARSLLRGRAVVHRSGSRRRPEEPQHTLAGARRRVCRPRLRDEDARGAGGRAGHRCGMAVGRSGRTRTSARPASAARRRRRDAARRRRVACAHRTDPRGRPPVGVGHE
jgi:hypothetical protein